MRFSIFQYTQIINNIKSVEEIKFSNHGKERIEERGINTVKLVELIINGEVVGLNYQGESRYEIIYEYDEYFDSCVITNYQQNKLKIITVILKPIERRVKQ